MWTSVPQTPAHRTRMSTSSSRIFGSGTFFSLKPGPAVSFTSAFTRDSSCVESVDVAAGARQARESSHDRSLDASNGKDDRIQNTEFRIQINERGAKSWLPVAVSEL